MRLAAFALTVVCALLLAGCGSESSRQAGARTAVEESLSASQYDRGRTYCTGNPAPWFVERETDVFVCVAKRHSGRCDWYRATLKNAGWEVVLERPNADCILPF